MRDGPVVLDPVIRTADPSAGFRSFGAPGDPGTRLLAGPPASAGPENLRDHLERLGPVPDIPAGRAAFAESVRTTGVRGRGGSAFPVARKLEALLSSGGEPLIVVNGSESEPASRKDATLIGLRPHLVLDGAMALSEATGARDVVVVLHQSDHIARVALERALTERETAGMDEPSFSIALGPDRYVAGEASAIVALLEGGEAKPRFNRQPAAFSGVGGRPTLIHNVETVAHLALLARFGDDWFAAAGSPGSPGSTLVTLAGAVATPGTVLEVVAPVPLGEILATAGGVSTPPAAVLVGGYAGTWIDGSTAWDLMVDREAFAAVGASLGCGLLGILPHGNCGIVESARLMAYLAGESAGQCGPCAFGLPALSSSLDDLAACRSSRAEVRRMHRRGAGVIGRGACGHPDGAVMLVESALDVFGVEVRRHLGWKGCSGVGCGPVFPLPRAGTGSR
jgi:NADH:ubiquinone oxidoreductase subunit F (NADH-binding)